MRQLFFALWFFLPAGMANVTPIFVAKMPGLSKLNAPVDHGLYFRGKQIFGSHKTWRGLICGIIVATITLWLQQIAVRHNTWLQSITHSVHYLTLPTLVLGPLFGIGALGGDMIESFFKRQLDIAPGHSWFPFDQTDYIIGGSLASTPFVHLQFTEYLILLGAWLIIHIVSSAIGYLLGLKERPI